MGLYQLIRCPVPFYLASYWLSYMYIKDKKNKVKPLPADTLRKYKKKQNLKNKVILQFKI